eukprot:scaffold4809_cov116-Cylindrotheca_fusiformis.AAC.9
MSRSYYVGGRTPNDFYIKYSRMWRTYRHPFPRPCWHCIQAVIHGSRLINFATTKNDSPKDEIETLEDYFSSYQMEKLQDGYSSFNATLARSNGTLARTQVVKLKLRPAIFGRTAGGHDADSLTN